MSKFKIGDIVQVKNDMYVWTTKGTIWEVEGFAENGVIIVKTTKYGSYEDMPFGSWDLNEEDLKYYNSHMIRKRLGII